ncbi:MAG: Rho termination factor N-terminal domain-containing protein [Candidatus Helarchaeota archaeon]
MVSKIDDKEYLKYLFQLLNLKELKQVCKDYGIKGYSKFKKADLIDFILGSMSDEEIEDFLKTKELDIISKAIDDAFTIIDGTGRESISNIRVKNPDNHEVEINFKGFNWETSSYLSITKENISNPERDCDCRMGSEGGLCAHFWVGFILSLKQKYFDLKDWKMTKLPKYFKNKIKSISISKVPTDADEKTRRKAGSSVILVDKSSVASKLSKFLDSRVTIEGKIQKITERQSEYEGHVTKFYVLSLEDVKIGPQLKKKSEYDESKIEEVSKINVRLSEKNFEKITLKEGDMIRCNGRLEKDNFWGYILKRTSNIQKIEK